MRFHICLSNHNPSGQYSLYDQVVLVKGGLEELGHTVTVGRRTVDPSCLNLFFENFFPGMAEEILKSKIEYGIIATEVPDGQGGFNWERNPLWDRRWKTFPEVARRARFIWQVVVEGTTFYSQFAPVGLLEFGFCKKLIPEIKSYSKEIDFLFCGTHNEYRDPLVLELKKHANVVWPAKIVSPQELVPLMGRAKIGITLRHSPKWPYASPTRIAKFLHAKLATVSDPLQIIARPAHLISVAKEEENFVDFAMNALSGNWRAQGEEAFDRYAREMPMSQIMERLLDETYLPQKSQVAPQRKKTLELMNVGKIREFFIRLLLPRFNLNSQAPFLRIMNYNIVFFCGRFIALHDSLGALDVTEHPEVLKKQHADKVHCSNSFLKTLGVIFYRGIKT